MVFMKNLEKQHNQKVTPLENFGIGKIKRQLTFWIFMILFKLIGNLTCEFFEIGLIKIQKIFL
jgi:hypothetical protein